MGWTLKEGRAAQKLRLGALISKLSSSPTFTYPTAERRVRNGASNTYTIFPIQVQFVCK